MKPIRQTDASLEIDTSQFHLSIPGKWEAQEAESPQTLFCGRSQDRNIIIAGHVLQDGLSAPERLEAVGDLLQVYIDTEAEVSKGETKVYPQDPVLGDNLIVAGYIGTHPDAGRVVFCRILCDHEKAFSIHWEASGFASAPDINALSQEFLGIVESAELK